MHADPQHDRDAAAAAAPGERHALLGPRRRGDDERRPAARRAAVSMASLAGSLHVPQAHDGGTIVALLCVVIFILMASTGFYVIPLTRIVEDVVCREYYLAHPLPPQGVVGPIDEALCKLEPIQSRVAFFFAVTEAAGSLASFLAALPWGIAADRIGRKPVVSVALLGLFLQTLWIMMVLWWHTIFPVWALCVAAGFVLLGGGSALLVGVLLSIISDVVEEEKRALAFMKIHITGITGSLLSPSLASVMMRATGPWPVMWVSELCLVLGGCAFLFLPETAARHKAGDPDSDADGENGQDDPPTLATHVRHAAARVRESLSILKSPSLVVLLLTALSTTPIAAACLQILVQFISKRYGLALQDTGYVQTAFGAAQVLQGLVLLPAASRLVLLPQTPWPLRAADEQQRDLRLARASYALLALGFLLMGAAPTLPWFLGGLAILALGGGASSLVRSLMSLYVDRAHRTRLFSLVGMVEVVGTTYGPPLLAALFTLGMRLDGPWIGLPYWGIAAICLLPLAALCFVRLPNDKGDAPPAYEEARDGDAYRD